MKPVAILRYAPHEGPGYFAAYLERQAIPWRLVRIDEGEPLPAVADVSGLGLMGGPMSVNDELPWIPRVLDLVRDSAAAGVPVIGHCLGGQLLARALGGAVTVNSVKEIGWGAVQVLESALARLWGPGEDFLSYHWHGECFSIPPGATRIWASAYCENQAFVIGPHLAMQCHVEMTREMIDDWCRSGALEIEQSLARSPAVQTPQAMRVGLADRLAALHRVADRVYARWTSGLVRG